MAVAALCAQFPLPILTGIGHTRDVSVLDMVAFQALKTPTAVAAFLVERMDEQMERMQRLTYRLQQTALRQVLLRRHRVEQLVQRLYAGVQSWTMFQRNHIRMLEQRVEIGRAHV